MHAMQVATTSGFGDSGGCADANDAGPQEWSRMLLFSKEMTYTTRSLT